LLSPQKLISYLVFWLFWFHPKAPNLSLFLSGTMGTENSSVDISEPLLVEARGNEEKEEYLREEIPEWKEQITIRGLVVSAVLGSLFCIITHKLNLTVGIIPSLNVAAGLLGFFFVRTWTGFLTKMGFFTKPFTRQENTVIQTCVVACYGLAFSGISLSLSLSLSLTLVCFGWRLCFDWSFVISCSLTNVNAHDEEGNRY